MSAAGARAGNDAVLAIQAARPIPLRVIRPIPLRALQGGRTYLRHSVLCSCAREGLHAGLVVMARHGRGWEANDAASLFTPADAEWQELVTSFLARVATAEPDELQDVKRHLGELEAQWTQLAARAEDTGGLRYSTNGGRQHVGLLHRFGQRGPGWETLDSMRSIDVQVRLRIRGEED